MSRVYKTIKYRATVNNKLNQANEKEYKKSNFLRCNILGQVVQTMNK